VILLAYFILFLYFCIQITIYCEMKEIGEKIKQRRIKLKITQMTLAQLAGIGINTVVAIERGEGNPRLKTLVAIANTLGLKLDIRLKE
jgi:y4mF family transcriptional regulator